MGAKNYAHMIYFLREQAVNITKVQILINTPNVTKHRYELNNSKYFVMVSKNVMSLCKVSCGQVTKQS